MSLEFRFHGTPDPSGRFVGYTPAPLDVVRSGAAPMQVTLSCRPQQPGVGEFVFYPSPDVPGADTIDVDFTTGDRQSLWIGGKFGAASRAAADTAIEARAGASLVGTASLMVRVRKNANLLTDAERDRFLAALRDVNAAGTGVYEDFRDMHVATAAVNTQEHQGPQFLPWHRAYLLDLERELQTKDASVTLPYWRFDEVAARVFSPQFMGSTARSVAGQPPPAVTLAPGHALSGWVTDGVPGILRGAWFDPQSEPAPGLPFANPPFPLLTQAETLALGTRFQRFARMEGSPHGAAHVSFSGYISDIDTAPKDPLFFLLHCNVDRLWALWQWMNRRFDPGSTDAYRGEAVDGRRATDTMWPWNNVKLPPRPNFAPRGQSGLLGSSLVPAPGPKPTVGSTIDYQGLVRTTAALGYDYDDVPYEPLGAPPVP